MARRNGGFIGTDGLDAPDPPTGVTATAGDAQVSVAFTAPTDAGTSAITGFVAQVSTNDTAYSAGSNTGTSSPIVVSSLTNDTAATAKVWAINAYGTSAASDASSSFTPVASVAQFFGGRNNSNTVLNSLERVLMASTGNGTDTLDLTAAQAQCRGNSSSTRGIQIHYGFSATNVVDFTTFASTGDAQDFGDLSQARSYGGGNAGNGVRAIAQGGAASGSSGVDTIDFRNIASAGDFSDFGNCTAASIQSGGASSPTRGIFPLNRTAAGGGSRQEEVDFITIASAGNAADFGNLSRVSDTSNGASNSTRALFNAFNGTTQTIDFFTIATQGNATDFGDFANGNQPASQTVFKDPFAAASNSIKALFAGGITGSGAGEVKTNRMEFFTIASAGNGTDFGDLAIERERHGSNSNTHGGIE